MKFIKIIMSLIFIGIISYYSGKIVERIKLPSLIGMIISGMIIGPVFLNIIPAETISISPQIKDIALITVLFIGGLGISISQMKSIGRPAVLLSVVPALIEGLTIALLSMLFLKFTFIQGGILGFIIAAVSPAVLVPSMVELINKRIGQDKAIPQMLLVGASADDTVAITLFTTFLAAYISERSGEKISIIGEVISIPTAILFSIAIGWLLAIVTSKFIKYINNIKINIFLVLMICVIIRMIENITHFKLFNALLIIMIYGFFLRTYLGNKAKDIQDGINIIWKYGKLYLFAFVGMAINPKLVGEFLGIGVIMLCISLTMRSIGVLISLRGTNLSLKERLFCVIAYLPKATVQSAKSGIPISMGVAGGEIMQAIAILSVLITAPIGAIGIKLTAGKFLKLDNANDEEMPA